MAGRTQQIIDDIRRLRQELIAAGKASNDLNKSIESTARTGINIRSYGRAGAENVPINPQSLEREVSRLIHALETGGKLSRTGSLGAEARYTPAQVARDIKRDLEYQFKELTARRTPEEITNIKSRAALSLQVQNEERARQMSAKRLEEIQLTSARNVEKLNKESAENSARINREAADRAARENTRANERIEKRAIREKTLAEKIPQEAIPPTKQPPPGKLLLPANVPDRITTEQMTAAIKKNDAAAQKAALELEKLGRAATRVSDSYEKQLRRFTDPVGGARDVKDRDVYGLSQIAKQVTRTTPPIGGIRGEGGNVPQTPERLIKDFQAVRKAMEDLKIPTKEIDAAIERFTKDSTADIKQMEAALQSFKQTLTQSFQAAKAGGTAVGGGTRQVPAPGSRGALIDIDRDDAERANRAYIDEFTKEGIVQDRLRGVLPERAVQKILPGIEKQVSGITALKKEIDSLDIKTKQLSNNTQKVTVTFRDQQGILSKEAYLLRQVGENFDLLATAQQRISQTQLKNLQEDPRNAGVFKRSKQYGFAPENLYQTRLEESTGIQSFDFKKVDEYTGAVRKATIATNKYGEILVDTQKRFRSFGDAIVRDTVEVLKWSIAVGIVYGTIQKLQEAIKSAIDNQSKLVDINIALGRAQGNLNDIFENAARISRQTGENLSGVLDGYVQAYRAAGDARTEFEKTTIANKFLTDSLILSKLSALDQAEALDILSGALKQLQEKGDTTDQMFQRSSELLDKWVVTTRNANVDLATLATAFSVTSESADNAGLSVEELNGVIAVLAEKLGALSPKEAGNTVRALIGGIYSESAAKALAQYGIAVTDASGKSRDFLEIMQQINELSKAGLISEDQLNKLALTLGGGVRRGQQYLAFLTSIDKVYSLVGKQANSTGAAQDALGQKLNTVETSVTNLGNAFMELAQSLGNEGGVLDMMKTFLGVATSLVEVLNGLTKAAGTAGPALVAVLAGAAYFSGENKGPRMQGLMGLLGGIGPRYAPPAPGMEGPAQRTGSTGLSAYNFLTGGTTGGKVAVGALGGILPAIGNLQKGDALSAGANIAGGIVGSLLTAGNPIGAVIGAAIAGTLTKSLQEWFDTNTDTAENFFSGALGRAFAAAQNPPSGGSVTTYQEERTTREQELYKQLFKLSSGFGGEGTARFGTGILAGGANLGSQILAPILTMLTGKQAEPLNYTQEDIATLFAYAKDNEETRRIVQELADIQKQKEKEAGGGAVQGTTTLVREEEIRKANEDFFASYAREVSSKLLQKVTTGEITAKESVTARERLPKAEASAVQLQATVGEAFQGVTGIATEQESLKRLMDILISAPEEATLQLAAMNSEINSLTKLIGEAKGGTVLFQEKQLSTIEASSLLTEKIVEQTSALKGLNTAYARAQIKLPQVMDYTEVTKKQSESLIEDARIKQEAELRAILPGISDADLQTYVEGLEPIWLKLKDGYQQVFNIDPKYLDEVRDFAIEAGKILKDNIDFSFFEADKFNIARQYYQGTKSKLEQAGYVAKEEAQIVMLDDGTIQNLTYDNKIMSLLMSQLVDISRKQLDGIYNLPTDASFYIPAQAAAYFPGGGEGGLSAANIEKMGIESGGDISTTGTTEEKVIAGYEDKLRRMGEEEERIQEQLNAQIAQTTGATTTKPKEQDFSWLDGWLTRQTQRNATSVEQAINKTLGLDFSNSPGTPPPVPGTEDTGFLKNMIDSLTALSKQSMNFKLSLSSSTNLLLDGRVVANAIKQYLSDDLLTAAQSTYTKNSVI